MKSCSLGIKKNCNTPISKCKKCAVSTIVEAYILRTIRKEIINAFREGDKLLKNNQTSKETDLNTYS